MLIYMMIVVADWWCVGAATADIRYDGGAAISIIKDCDDARMHIYIVLLHMLSNYIYTRND